MNIIGLTKLLTIIILFVVLFTSATAVLQSEAAKFGGIKPKPKIIGKKLTEPIAPRIAKHSSTTEIHIKVDAAKPLYSLKSFPDILSYVSKNTQEFHNHLYNSLNVKILGFYLVLSHKQ